MRRYLIGEEREQFRVMSFDCQVGMNHIVRVIDAFVDCLNIDDYNLKFGVPKKTGRKAYHPMLMLKLYIYGYTQGIRSSRKLEKATHENIPFIWLMHELKPDFKTISNFRKDNIECFKQIFKDFTRYCYSLKLIDLELVAIDGTYIDAVNHNSNNYTTKKLNTLLQLIDHRIDKYFEKMDKADKDAIDSDRTITEMIAKRDFYDKLIKESQKNGATQISTTDPDSRMMRKGGSKADVCYNAQAAVDSKHKLIANQDVTNETNDSHQLFHMAESTKEIYGKETLSVVADKGYGNGKEIKACNDNNITTYVPIQNNERKRGTRFATSEFKYNAKQNYYECPEGRILPFSFYHKSKNSNEYGSKKTCKDCKYKIECISGKTKRYRTISRTIYRDILDTQENINKENGEILSKRKSIVEHPFGTIKRNMKQGYFLTKGLKMVKGEFSLTCLTYNIKRVMSILGVDRMIASMKWFFKKGTNKKCFIFKFLIIFIGKSVSKANFKQKWELEIA